MSILHVVLCKVPNPNIPVFQGTVIDKLTIETTTVHQETNPVPTEESSDVWDLTVSGGPVWIKFYQDSNAERDIEVDGGDWLLLDGANRQFLAKKDQVLAVMDAVL